MPPVYHDRVLALGFTGSGKSELLNVMFSQLRTQKLLVDSKHEFAIRDTRAEHDETRAADELPQLLEPVHDPGAIDWTQPVIHYRPATTTAAEYDELFEACFRRDLVVCVHELADVCEENPNRAPRHFSRYCAQGRARGLGLLAGSQRPVNMPKRALTEAQHFYYFVPPLTADDHDLVARHMGQDPAWLRMQLDNKHAELGDYAYLQYERTTRELAARPPLPEHLRARNIVTRTMDV